MSRLLSYQPDRLRFQTFDTDTDARTAIINTYYDVEPVMELNKALRNGTDEKARWGGEGMGVLAARIPTHIYFDLMRGVSPGDEDEIERRLVRYLADPASPWRVRGGRI